MVRLVRESDVQKIIKRPGAMREAINAIEEAFRRQAQGEVTVAPRSHIFYPPDATTLEGIYQHALRILPAIVPHANAVGARIFTTMGGAPPRCEIIPLWRFEDMQLIAIIADSQDSLHRVRTAAPCGVATRHLAVADAATVGIYGSGNHARGQLEAVAVERPVRLAKVYSPNPAHRRAFAEEMTEVLGFEVQPVDKPEEAARGTQVIIGATRPGNAPVIRGAWLDDGVHINSISRNELDFEAIKRARVFVPYRQQFLNDLPPWEPFPGLFAAGKLAKERAEEIIGELGDALVGRVPGRSRPDEITIFVNTGLGVWDVAIGAWVYDIAVRERLGVDVELWDT